MDWQKIWEELKRRERRLRNYKDSCIKPLCSSSVCDPASRAGCTSAFEQLLEVKELIRAKCPGNRETCNYPGFRIYCPAWRSSKDCS